MHTASNVQFMSNVLDLSAETVIHSLRSHVESVVLTLLVSLCAETDTCVERYLWSTEGWEKEHIVLFEGTKLGKSD